MCLYVLNISKTEVIISPIGPFSWVSHFNWGQDILVTHIFLSLYPIDTTSILSLIYFFLYILILRIKFRTVLSLAWIIPLLSNKKALSPVPSFFESIYISTLIFLLKSISDHLLTDSSQIDSRCPFSDIKSQPQ